MNEQPYEHPNITELKRLDPELVATLDKPDAAAQLLRILPGKYPPEQIATPLRNRAWELAALCLLGSNRVHEALSLFWALYQQMLAAQTTGGRIHKGMPLVWIGECFSRLDFPVHAKRYLMLTLCEDALAGSGRISPESSGVYFRLVWGHGLSDEEVRRYVRDFFDLAQEMASPPLFPEALLQGADDAWLTELPSAREASSYRVNPRYMQYLLSRLGDGSGQALELLAEYLMSCMPGCRTKRRQRSGSTDYDLVCAMEGSEVDYRSELGRYFVCECKDWNSVADFTVMAKFCRVLDSIKSKFGILFSKNGISGAGTTEYAEREQLKVFQDRGMVIVVLGLSDLEKVATGANLIGLLRKQYEAVRLDLKA